MTTRKPNGYWQSLENTSAEALKAMEEQGWETLPSHDLLRKHGYSPLKSAIYKHHGGIRKFRVKLGQQNTTKPNRYWKSLDNTVHEAQQAMKKHKWNTLPSQQKLATRGYLSLSFAIVKYHGGFQKFRTTLGQTNTKKPKDYWKSLDNTIKEAQQAMKKHHWEIFPPKKLTDKHGYSSLNQAITKYHGGIRHFRTKLGQQNPNTKPRGYWQSLDNTVHEAQQAMTKHKWKTLPSQQELRKHGYTPLTTAISAYHGGLHQFRKALGQTNSRKPRGYWQSLDNTIKEAQQAMKKHHWKTLPTQNTLEKNRYSSLVRAISTYHGKIRTFRNLLTEHITGKNQKQQLEELLDEYIAA